MDKKPLVSVGIPCYNRPEGLRKTLECITGQTYRNLEIIVSDNCSPNPEVERVGREFANLDRRIQYIRHPTNYGASFNFRYVLRTVTGEYFMWAADDDEWLPEFIEMNLRNIGDSGSCFTDFVVRNRFKNSETRVNLPISSEKSKYINALLYLNNLTPNMIYGLHKTNLIMWVIKSEFFDFWDCYFCLRQIIEYGFNAVDSPLYLAGTDTEEYIKKPFYPRSGRLFTYTPFFKSSLKSIISSKKINNIHKVSLVYALIKVTLGLFVGHEKDEQPFKVLLISKFMYLMRGVDTLIKTKLAWIEKSSRP
jgi:glycosyltransferase involved in cell wall biosynthesis